MVCCLVVEMVGATAGQLVVTMGGLKVLLAVVMMAVQMVVEMEKH